MYQLWIPTVAHHHGVALCDTAQGDLKVVNHIQRTAILSAPTWLHYANRNFAFTRAASTGARTAAAWSAPAENASA
jgi:hypothetical protein